MAALKYWVWLTALPGLSNRSRLLLLERYGSPEDVYYADAEELALTEGLTPGQAQLLSDKSLTRADRILADCARGDIFLLTMQDAAYPARLRDIFDPPVLLYGKGSLPLFDEEAAIAVVGTRSCTPYGLRCAHRMGYELARQGKEVERRPRPVTIHALELVEQTASGDYVLRVRCSKGTYVRTLCHDIGQALGCGCCMAALRRTMAAGFTLSDAVTLEQVQAEGEALLRPVDSLFRDRPAYVLPTPWAVARCRNGNPVSVSEPLPEGEYRVYDPEGDFLCLSRLEGGVLTSIKNFFGA